MGVLEKKILPVLDGKQIPPPIHQSTETINIRSRESSIESAARSVSGRQPTGYQVFFSRPGQKTEKRIFESYSQQSRFSRCGTKKQRRRDNFHSLLALREEGDELTTQDIIPNSQSVFALLLQDPAKMEAWNVFLACSEEEQDEILASQSLWVDGLDQPSTIHQEESYQTKFEFEDKRLLHPGYTSMEAFDRLSGKLKTVLKRKKLPLGVLFYLEEEISDFFTNNPRGVITLEIPSSFDRLLLHAVSEYHLLSSTSFLLDNQRRGTMIKNRYENFIKPDMSLGEFVEKKFGVKRS